MTSRLTRAIHLALIDRDYPHTLTAQGVTTAVRKSIPGTKHIAVKAELQRLIKHGNVKEIHRPHLPTRYIHIFRAAR